MAELLFISPQEMTNTTILGGNVDFDKYRLNILNVQKTVIEPLLGTELYDKIVADVTAATITGDYETIRSITVQDPRIGNSHSFIFHKNYRGYGGHCLPKDTWLLRFGLNEYGTHKMEPRFITLAREINNHMPIHMAHLVEDALNSKGLAIHDANVTILGAAYLENSDDTRNTPAATLVSVLESKGAKITIHDPHVKEWEFGTHKIGQDINKAVQDADCLALVTRHREYIELDFESLKGLMRTPVFVDGRNVFDEDDVTSKGFEYRAIGKSGTRND